MSPASRPTSGRSAPYRVGIRALRPTSPCGHGRTLPSFPPRTDFHPPRESGRGCLLLEPPTLGPGDRSALAPTSRPAPLRRETRGEKSQGGRKGVGRSEDESGMKKTMAVRKTPEGNSLLLFLRRLSSPNSFRGFFSMSSKAG